jgi:AP2 domain
MVVLLYLKKQEETAHYIIHIMWYRGEYMGCENLAGMKFAHLLVLKRDEMKKSTHSYWLCQCDCGTICSVAGTHLKTGHTKSCGCYRKRKQVHGWLDLTGKRYGRLQVLGPWEKHSPLLEVVKEGESSVEEGKLAAQGDLWFCQCDCGKHCVCQKENLRFGKTRSCGCLRQEQRKANMRNSIHFAENTCLERIASRKEAANNTSGHRGVYRRENGKWRASIGFQGKVYNLGTFVDYEDAVKARLEAEKKYYDRFLEQYQNRTK